MIALMDIVERIKKLENVRTMQEVADALHMPVSTLRSYKTRNIVPYDRIIEYCHEKGVDPLWLIYGEISPYLKKDVDDFVVIDYYEDILASAGYGCTNDELVCEPSALEVYKKPDGKLVVPEEVWPELRSSKVDAIRVFGDSMEPTIKDGSIAFVKRDIATIVSGKIYIIRYQDELFIKRIFRGPGKSNYIVKSDNPIYPQFELDETDFTVVAQLLYATVRL